MSETKPSNPKDILGSDRAPLGRVPETALAYASLAFLEGALKYGTANWRVVGVRTSIYHDAILRHLAAWWNGQDADPDTNVPHLASVIAGAAILLDAGVCGKLEDDRPPAAPMKPVLQDVQMVVAHLKRKFQDCNPRHYTLADTPPVEPTAKRVILYYHLDPQTDQYSYEVVEEGEGEEEGVETSIYRYKMPTEEDHSQ